MSDDKKPLAFSLENYIDVAERISHFHERYPEGTLQTLDWEVRDVGGHLFVVYRAAAFRTANDRRPGHGIAWEPFPGETAYTRNSELMNAETAAWGRAIVALGLTASRKIASKQEVRARQGEGKPAPAAPADDGEAITDADRAELTAAAKGLRVAQIKMALTSVGIPHPPPERDLFSTTTRNKAALLAMALAETERERV